MSIRIIPEKKKSTGRYLLLTAILAAVFLSILTLSACVGGNRWTVTQYAPPDERQHMFYTITDQRGRLVVIDGGWEDEADQVRSVINSLGGHVNAWIITHPHPDHVGALNDILAHYNEEKIRIDHIYTVKVREARYRETAEYYDDYASYEKFSTHCKNLGDMVTYLKENDEIDLIGLKMKVFSAWDERVDQFENNECNQGSMMFRLAGREKSILFCADVQKEMEAYILPAHADELASDYVQLAHHGNWGLTKAFYDLVNPIGAFFDGPASIIDTEDGIYDGHELRDYLNDKNVTLYRFSTAPNTVELN